MLPYEVPKKKEREKKVKQLGVKVLVDRTEGHETLQVGSAYSRGCAIQWPAGVRGTIIFFSSSSQRASASG